jgi:5'-3' exonuclease
MPFNNSDCNLFCKIVTGDKSDNIPSIFKKCGIKTALKYYNDKNLFEAQLEKSKDC